MKELASVTKIKPRRGASTYVPTRELKNVNNVEVGDQIIMNWSKDDRKVVGESLDSKPLHLGNDYNKPRNTCCHNITRWYVKEVPMFDPRNKWRIRWDVLLMLFIIVNAICVPIDIAVNLESTVGLIIVNNVADTFFLIDINCIYAKKSEVATVPCPCALPEPVKPLLPQVVLGPLVVVDTLPSEPQVLTGTCL